MNERNLAASVRARLLNRAKASEQDFNWVLTRYAIERLLYRIGISGHADRFLLKGALLFDLWFDFPHRPTRDADFLGFGAAEIDTIAGIFREICSLHDADGVVFDPASVVAGDIRKEAGYGGVRVMLTAMIDGARCRLQVDIGFGDAVTPAPEQVAFPVMLPEFAAPKLGVYPRYTVVAEKLEAMIAMGMANSRLKDYFDLWVLAHHAQFDGLILQRAVQATCLRRKTDMPDGVPIGLSDEFASDAQKNVQWQAFLKKNRLLAPALNEVVYRLRTFLMPALDVRAGSPSHWPAGGPWA